MRTSDRNRNICILLWPFTCAYWKHIRIHICTLSYTHIDSPMHVCPCVFAFLPSTGTNFTCVSDDRVTRTGCCVRRGKDWSLASEGHRDRGSWWLASLELWWTVPKVRALTMSADHLPKHPWHWKTEPKTLMTLPHVWLDPKLIQMCPNPKCVHLMSQRRWMDFQRLNPFPLWSSLSLWCLVAYSFRELPLNCLTCRIPPTRL